jgi:hypothetical protein
MSLHLGSRSLHAAGMRAGEGGSVRVCVHAAAMPQCDHNLSQPAAAGLRRQRWSLCNVGPACLSSGRATDGQAAGLVGYQLSTCGRLALAFGVAAPRPLTFALPALPRAVREAVGPHPGAVVVTLRGPGGAQPRSPSAPALERSASAPLGFRATKRRHAHLAFLRQGLALGVVTGAAGGAHRALSTARTCSQCSSAHRGKPQHATLEVHPVGELDLSAGAEIHLGSWRP